MSNPASWRTSTVTALLVLALAAGGCSGDDSGDDASDPSSSPGTAQAAPPEVKIRVLAGHLAGELPKKRRHAVARDVGRVVDRWFVAAYLGGEYPRARFKDSWPGFTVGANALARHDRLLTSNAQLGDRIDGVRAVSKIVKVDVFSPKKKPAGATARFRWCSAPPATPSAGWWSSGGCC